MKVMKKRPLLITAAGNVNPNLYGDLGKIFTSHIPISGKLAILGQVEKATKKYDDIYILIDSSAHSLGNLLHSKYGVIPILGRAKDSLTQTLNTALGNIESSNGLDVLFGDSYNSDLLEKNINFENIVFTSKRVDSAAWKCVKRDPVNLSLDFFESSDNLDPVEIVTGSFRISDLPLFKEILYQEFHINDSINSFWNAWKFYDFKLDKKVELVEDFFWQDIGHVDTYFAARRQLISASTRAFNQISMNVNSMRITKTGIKDKINLEKEWFNEIPPDLRIYTPNTYQSQNLEGYEIEYETSIPVNEMWISGNDDDSYWTLFSEKLQELLKKMHSNTTTKLTDENAIYKQEIFLNKVINRVESFLSINNQSIFDAPNLILNEKKLPSLRSVLIRLEEVTNRISSLNNWSIIHGDLCLSNIIYDRRKDQIKLIDPRGSFVNKGIFGDPIYDIAKLSHSILGNYDFFACNLFYLNKSGNKFELQLGVPNNKNNASKICERVILSQLNKYEIAYEELRILESGLFLSAAALHSESDRGQALFLNGLNIAGSVL
jgi:hypothetical protein